MWRRRGSLEGERSEVDQYQEEASLHHGDLGCRDRGGSNGLEPVSHHHITGVPKHFPGARNEFDLLHLMKLAGEALDRVRKDLRREGAELQGSLWAMRGNAWTRNKEKLEQRRQLARTYPALRRAMALRDCWGDVLKDGDLLSSKWWLGWAARSRLAPFQKLARTLKQPWAGILAYLETQRTNAAIEGVNGLWQLARRVAQGFRQFHYFRLAADLKAGHLDLGVPQPTAHLKRRGAEKLPRGVFGAQQFHPPFQKGKVGGLVFCDCASRYCPAYSGHLDSDL